MNASRIILGTVQFGLPYGINNSRGKPREAEVFQILDAAKNAGISILDTADAYGNATDIIGRYHAQSDHRFIINTKFHLKNGEPVSTQLHNSLRRLNTGTVDTYFFHDFNEMVDHPEALHELNELKAKQLIHSAGVSVYDNNEFSLAIETPGIDTIQIPFNLLDNVSQRGSMLKKAKQKNKTIQARSVFLQGLFFKEASSYPGKLLPLKKYMSSIHEIVHDAGSNMEAVALNYVMQQPEIDHIVLGIDSCAQLECNLQHIGQELPAHIMQRINNITVKEVELLYPKNWA